MKEYVKLVDKLRRERRLEAYEMKHILRDTNVQHMAYLNHIAKEVARNQFGANIFVRGLIEMTNRCRNDCYYCGIRKSNPNLHRYYLTESEILACAKQGYEAGIRTFVLQGGEDSYYTDERLGVVISYLKTRFPDCAVTLSFGERSLQSYQALYAAGADRYLLREETGSSEHYAKLHPKSMSYENRIQCLYNLKEIGYQTGCGFLVGSPYQTLDTILQDLQLIQQLEPHMIGIGPFIPQKDTPFADCKPGSTILTLTILSILRLMNPHVLLPATTALNTLLPNGRERGICAGANVVMPNLSPMYVREHYQLYNNKHYTKEEAVEGMSVLKRQMESIGYDVVIDRGDYA